MASTPTHRVTSHVKDRILTVSDILSTKECNQLIQAAEDKGFKDSPPSGGGHGSTPRQGARTSQFCVYPNPELADKLWTRLAPFAPADLRSIKLVPYMSSVTKGDEYGSPVGILDWFVFYKYDPGQYILKHDDYRRTRYRYDSKTDTYYYQITFFTVLLYLNEDFEGGETCFWTKYATVGTTGHCRFIRDIEFTPADLRISPVTGTALIQDHMVQHEGEAPEARGSKSGVKYILKTAFLHEREVPKARVDMKIKKGECYSEWQRHPEPSCQNYTE